MLPADELLFVRTAAWWLACQYQLFHRRALPPAVRVFSVSGASMGEIDARVEMRMIVAPGRARKAGV